MRRLARFGVCGSCIFENGAILQPVMIPMSLDRFSRADRVKTPRHHIDPGFVNHRLIFSTLGHDFREFYERRRLKSDDHMSLFYNDHLLVTYLLNSCHEAGVPTLGEVLQSPVVGSLFCSTELLNASPGVYGELPKIAAFCGVDIPPGRTDEILERCSFAYMKGYESKFDFMNQVLLERRFVEGAFIREGKTNSWTGLLTDSQNQLFEEAAGRWRRAEASGHRPKFPKAPHRSLGSDGELGAQRLTEE
jgi:hypothetical protein